jgi:hypothetical protein
MLAGIRTVYLQGVNALGGKHFVTLSCHSDVNTGDIKARDVRITAVRATGLAVVSI